MKEPKLVELKFDQKDLAKARKPLSQKSNSVDTVFIINLIQFLKPDERINFVNELFRVMKKGAKAQIITPSWSACRAYGDLMFQWPPISEAWYPHLNSNWRINNANWNTKYKCDFDHTLGYSMHPGIIPKNQEYQQHALTFFKEAGQDLAATIIRR